MLHWSLETLLVQCMLWHLHWSQEFEVYLHAKGVEHTSMKQLELVNDYDSEIYYHPRKANKVADVLSRKL